MIPYETIANTVNMSDVCRMYNIDVKRNGMALCPLHNEDTPSMRIYEHSYYCFGCGKGGNAINLVANLLNVSLSEAAKQIDKDFGIGMVDGSYDPIKAKAYKNKMQSAEKRKANYKTMLIELSGLFYKIRISALHEQNPERRAEKYAACERLLYINQSATVQDTWEVRKILERYRNQFNLA